MKTETQSAPSAPQNSDRIKKRHLAFGWCAILLFLTLGIGLEMLHGFKIPWYLGVDNSTRRLMWTLAHAHGTLLGLINVAFALSTTHVKWKERNETTASTALLMATILLPGGFFLGGLWIHGGDPGLAIILVPIGALVMLFGVGLTAKAALASRRS